MGDNNMAKNYKTYKNKLYFKGLLKKYFGLIIAAAAIILLVNTIISSLASKNPLEGKSILIDPGHGGNDTGYTDGMSFYEKNINLHFALELKKILEENKAFVTLTRNSDINLDSISVFNPLQSTKTADERKNQINSGKYDIFISLHVGLSDNINTAGPNVICSDEMQLSEFLGYYIQEQLNSHIKKELKLQISYNVAKSDDYIFKDTIIPGVIIQTGYMSNAREKQLLQDSRYRRTLCMRICDGIKRYFDALLNIDVNKGQPDEKESQPFKLINNIEFVNK